LFTFLVSIASNTYSQAYQYYFGNIHSHSSYSDGNKDAASGYKLPADNYSFAKKSYNFHFLGISEHNHAEAGMELSNYKKGLTEALAANKDGEFVCMYGMEYGVISNGGHVVVYGIDSLVGWEANNYSIYSPKSDYSFLWKIIAERPNAFATLAHPETGDYNKLSTSVYNDTADAAICGSAVRSGSAFSVTTDYTDAPPATTYTGYFRRMLAAGYKLGPTIDHDNHYATFGRTAQSRTVVLAQALQRDSITAAYKAMRFYASDDWNTRVAFTVNAYPLGSVIQTAVNPSINVSVTDPDNENVTSIRLYFGVPGSKRLSTVLASVSNTSSLSYLHNVIAGSSFYYYAEITQEDGDKIWTSPIWVYKQFSVLPITLVTLTGEAKAATIELKAQLSAKDYLQIQVEKSFIGTDFTPIETLENITKTNFSITDFKPVYGYQYYRLKCTNKDGQISYSAVIAVSYKDTRLEMVKVFPNPASTYANVIIESAVNANATCRIYDADGKIKEQFSQRLVVGRNTISKRVTGYARGQYFIVIETGSAKAEASIIKL
jgi:hypothetical protein